MANSDKIIQAAAGAAGGDPVYVEDVFATHLYAGNGAYQTITNGIDLLNEGGLVWAKSRTSSNRDNYLWDTERGYSDGDTNFTGNTLSTNTTSLEQSGEHVRNIYEDGYQSWGGLYINMSGEDYVSWTFRKQAGFFDVKTFTAESDSFVDVNHDLGCNIGAVVFKETSGTGDWNFWHKSFSENDIIKLNTTAAKLTGQGFISQQTSSSARFFTDANTTSTYVAYFFGDGDDSNAQSFGDNSDEAIIKCGTYTGSSSDVSIDLGWEPAFVITKAINNTSNWGVYDLMRNMSHTSSTLLLANLSQAEEAKTYPQIKPTATGMNIAWGNAASNAGSSYEYIYIAIRRPMKTPEAGTDVFKAVTYNGANSATQEISAGFPIDMNLIRIRTASALRDALFHTRLLGKTFLKCSDSLGERTFSDNVVDFGVGHNVIELPVGSGTNEINGASSSSYIAWFFKRAAGYFDVVAYEGTGTAHAENHNLGVTPELILIKNRDADGDAWAVYAGDETDYLVLNTTAATTDDATYWNDTAPTATQFTVGTQAVVNTSAESYVAYLFATLDGVSKVGSYTGTGSTINVDCGFSSGARFILIKRTDSAGGWYVWDSTRGINSGSEENIEIDTTNDPSSVDDIDPLSSGFQVVSTNAEINTSGGNYTFLAIA